MKNIGGQAVIEGVMMKSPKGWTVAVRDKNGQIHVKKEPLKALPRPFRLPVLRGVVSLLHALAIGIKALEYSAGKSVEGEKGAKPLGRLSIALTITASFALGIGLFIVLPLYATKLLGLLFSRVQEGAILFNLTDGVLRVAVFLLYVFLIGLWKEMSRIFEYHGAEHKVIHAYEHGKSLDPDEAKGFSPRHPRCGTSFLLIVMVVSMLVFSLIPQTWPLVYKFLSRIILIPFIAGVSYELLRLSARAEGNPIVRMLTAPGLFLQGLTTREPDRGQLEVAARALEEVLAFEEARR